MIVYNPTSDRFELYSPAALAYGTEVPADAVAYKHADPIEDARWIYDADEAREIAAEDPSLIAWVTPDR